MKLIQKLKDEGWGVVCVVSVIVYTTLAVLFVLSLAK